MSLLRSFLRDPLFAFVAGGALLFGASSLLPSGPDAGIVRVDDALRAALAASEEAKSGRPPTEAELQGLVRRWVDDELLVREARALGLDRGDPVLRRRMIEQMRLVASAGLPEPDDASLERFIDAHPERFVLPERVDLRQVFVRGTSDADERRALSLLASLSSGAAPEGLGDPAIGGALQKERSLAALVSDFGDEAARAILRGEPGSWTGPLRSARGLHLVRVERRQAARRPDLDSVRGKAQAGFAEEARREAEARLLASLRRRYRVVETP